ncbi:uncharacterized protein LOC112464703 isoform X2 [Temnothorax curvispinosus]|uniref:Uncharacterized protein LOC112464703 isoform X2 n=1 Tax=Temnothorax curvispinosus TaxID=300111 RepID=A0A6J1R3I0_9HYME|nr:uncharacterized protein LOC112464703 isoform X2 [Temnothorax curvispinosus]
MKFGENEPPWVQKCHIYRQAKMEHNKEDLGIKSGVKMDMITSIRNMLQDIRYSNAIREIGAKKFYVFYCSPEQIFVEKEYCRVRKGFSRICLDATGKVVKKFEIIPGRKTGHIFLYTITINFEGKTLPVYQMLSEKHDAVFITFWLQEWIRACKATIPDEAMSDLGRALLLAMCEAFNRMTLKEYVDVLFKWATKDRYKTPRPFNTLIRADVAHQMAAVARWKCIKDLRHPIVKGFYLRTIALMIDCQTVQEFEHVFRLTCIVALHLDQDESIMVSGKQVSVFEARRLLEEYMAEHGQIIEELETSRENVEIDEEVENTLNSVEEKDDKNLTVTHQWIRSLISMSTPPDQQKMECKAVNGFYFSEFIQSLERIAKEFPIWTAAALPGKQTHASTASQEGYFAEVRQRIFEGIPLPCSANRFLKEHIDDLHSGTNEVAAKLKHFNHNHRQPVPSPHTPEKESASQKPIRAPSSSVKESEFPRKAAPVSCSFDEELGFLSQEPISDSCLLDNGLGIFLQDPTPTACAANGELKLTLKKSPCSADQHSEFYSQIPVLSPPCSAGIKSAPSVRKPASDPRSADEGSKSSLQQPYINMNFNSISLLRERARMMNDSDLKSGEAWKGLVNEESCFVDVNEISPENQEESKNIQDTSQILSEVLDLQSSDIANIDRNLFIQPNNNTHGFSKNYEQDKLFTKKDPHAELSTPNSKEVIFSSTPLIDHNYSKLLSDEEVSTEFPKGDQQNLNPKCNKNKPEKVGFYFQSYPQIRFLNERFDNGGKRGFLLKNGLKLGIIKVGNIAVDLQKTCGFDAIIHILQFGALYDSRYHFFIQSSNNRALKFVCKFMKMGPTMEILRERIVLLNEFYPIVKDPEAPSIKPHKLIAEDSITQIWKNLFCCSEPTEPSAIRSSECNNPECVSPLPMDVAYFGGKCRQKKCPGTVTETTRSNFHIFIDLDTRTHRKKTHGLKYQLADVPITLNFIKQYRLIGVIEHISGHFIGYCQKPSGRWLKCDDMQLNVEGCDETVITPIGAIYIAL